MIAQARSSVERSKTELEKGARNGGANKRTEALITCKGFVTGVTTLMHHQMAGLAIRLVAPGEIAGVRLYGKS